MSASSDFYDVPLRLFEPVVVACVWILVFVVVIGPVIGSVLPGADEPVFTEEEAEDDVTTRGESLWHVINSVRGVLLLLTTLPVVFAYGYFRPRLVGQTPAEFWSMQDLQE